jgi:phospholipid N-methyltransferase
MKPRPDWVDKYKKGSTSPVRVEVVPNLFPTPTWLAERMVELAEIERHHRVLEPSAGTGCILRHLVHRTDHVSAVELNVNLVRTLRDQFETGDGHCVVYQADFLEHHSHIGYDRIVMNPPFGEGADMRHIAHAGTLLAQGAGSSRSAAPAHGRSRS